MEVVVGYSGGRQVNPTYKNIKDHSETVRVIYDPNLLSYEELIEYYFEELPTPLHSPAQYRQYRSALLVHSDDQRVAAEEKVQQLSTSSKGRKIFVDIENATDFYRAEEYHQKYLMKRASQRSSSSNSVLSAASSSNSLA